MRRRTSFLFSLFFLILLLPAVVSALGNISVTSTPSGAAIYLNGTTTGLVTPSTVENVVAGSNTILVRLSGYSDASQTVTVTDNAKSYASFTLSPTVSTPIITGISPSSGYNNNLLSGVGISGNGFLTSATVTLSSSGLTDIPGTGCSVTTTLITCAFPLSGKSPGVYNVIVRNLDTGNYTLSGAFTVNNATAATVTSITPNTGIANHTVSVTIIGTGFQSNPLIHLTRTNYNDISGIVLTQSSTQITGTFDLSNQAAGTWTTRVYYDGLHYTDGPSFTLNSDIASSTNGTVEFMSIPAGAGAYLDSIYEGQTVTTLYDYNVSPGSHTVRYKRTGYDDYTKVITVTAGNTTDATGTLNPTTIVQTTVPTTATAITTVRTTSPKSTKSVPTPWPSTTPTASPVDVTTILCATGLAFLVLRKR